MWRGLALSEVIFNGKFLAAGPTGVHRVALELISALDKKLAADSAYERVRASVYAPRNLHRELNLTAIPIVRRGMLKGIPWEQLSLPWAARGRRIVNLCNLGPVLAPNAITMIHDAQVHISPASYSLPFRLWYRLVQPLIGRFHRRILTVSHYSKAQIAKVGVAHEEKITVIHNGADHVLRIEPDFRVIDANGLAPGRYVLGLSNTQSHKNIAVLFRAMEFPGMQDFQLALFGSASRADFEVQGLVVPQQVTFLGTVTDEELAALMVRAHCLAFPSLTEGFGLPPLEAMYLGCPVVIAPCGALPEVCANAALAADPTGPGDWARQIVALESEPALRQDMIGRGRAQARKFTWARAAEELLKAIREA